MKLSKKELIDHLEQYPDDYELNLSHYFLVEAEPSTTGKNKGKPRFTHAQINIPITGTAADKNSKEIRFVLKSSNAEVLKRIEVGTIHPIQTIVDPEEKDDDLDDDKKNTVSVA